MPDSVDFSGVAPSALAVVSMHDAPGSEHPTSATVVDGAVHPRSRPGELTEYMPKVWKGRRLPAGDRYYYPNPLGDAVREARGGDGPPGSDPVLVSHHLFDEVGVARAVLLPLTLGLLPDLDLAAAICSATNAWLADQWLDRDARYRGTIRVAPNHPETAVAEIERWADHPGFVQVGVPMQSMALYGMPPFLPVWEAAARHGLPVALHSDAETGVELAPSPAGYLRHFLGFASYQPAGFVSHLASFMVHGVLDRLPDLCLVFADGGYDLCGPLLWRLDKDYRPMRGDMPWMKRLPSAYLREHVRFIAHRLEGPDDPRVLDEWLGMADAEHLLLYGSNYPSWDFLHPNAAFPGVENGVRERILAGNADDLYGGAWT